MKLDISRLRSGKEPVDRTFAQEAFADLKDDFLVAGPARLTGTVKREGTVVTLDGRVTATLNVPCSRCLEPFDVPVDATFETRFVPPGEFAQVTAQSAESGEIEGGADGPLVGLGEYRDEAIDLDEVVREQFFLALPMKPLCREECLGLCPVCGTNRNRELCGCKQEWVDPRLAALANFKKQ